MGSSAEGGGGGLAALLQNMPPRAQLALLQSMRAPADVPSAGMSPGGGGAIGAPGDPGIAAKIAQNMQAQGGPQRTQFGRPDPNDPRYASRAAEGLGSKAQQPDMSALLAARAAAPPAPPPLPHGIPLPRS